ncbi:hypothetical protein, partial [Streptomyces sp. NPDC058739]|uniref:hypothetical protein n=1 Tax=Streptomyces sp. NPDC058739 TaxID=3346618 RepID=UPI003694697A
MPKPLLLLGAGGPAAYTEFTVAQIAAAHPIVLADSWAPTWVRPYLTHHLATDLTDSPAALEAVRRYTASHELGGVLALDRQHLMTAAQIIHAKVPQGAEPQALAACSTPAGVRRLLKQDLLQPRWAVARDAESVAGQADTIGYPVDLRPLTGPGGAAGPARNRAEVLDVYRHVRRTAPAETSQVNHVLVEEHLVAVVFPDLRTAFPLVGHRVGDPVGVVACRA